MKVVGGVTLLVFDGEFIGVLEGELSDGVDTFTIGELENLFC